MTRIVNFRASVIPPNPKEVMYWVDLEEDPTGGIIKYYDEELQYWTTLRILEGSIVKVEERIQKWVSEKLQEWQDDVDERIKEFEGRILIIEGDIRDLKEGKQDKLTAGYGIDIDENNVISCIIDTSLYEIVTELPKDNINSNKIYILIEPSADAVNLLEDITVSDYLYSITEDEVTLELYQQSATDSHNYIRFNRDVSARFTISSTEQGVGWHQYIPGQGNTFYLSTDDISSGYIHAKQGPSEITSETLGGMVTITVDSASKNQFTEYVYTGDRWEILGQDLTPFALDTDLQQEINRALRAEYVLSNRIYDEVNRAKAEEARIEKKAEDLVRAEQSRAEGVEADLQQQINDEIDRAEAAEDKLTRDLAAEVTRATNAETVITNNLNAEISRAQTEEARLEKKVEDLVKEESDRAKAAEQANANAISAETSRATAAENAIDAKLDAEIARAKQAEEDLDDRITSTGGDLQSEINRAKAAEATLQANITAEQTRATTAEDTIRTNLNNEITRSTNEDNAIKARVTTAEGNISTIQTNLSPIKAAWDKQGQKDGLLVLGDNGLVKQANLPSYVDDVLDIYATYDKSATGVLSNIKLYKDSAKTQAVTPESGKIYIDVTGNYQFRWTGTQYVTLGTPTVLGTITGTAYDGGEGNKNRQALNSLPNTILTDTGIVNHNANNVTWTNQLYVSKQSDMTYGSKVTATTKTFNAATTTLAGVMTPSDKKTINQIRKIPLSHVNTDATTWTKTNSDVKLNFTTLATTDESQPVSHSVSIGAATTTTAGVMTAADKTKLDNLSAGTNSPYVKKSGDTMTGPLNLKGEQYDGNYALNLNNSDLIGINSLVFADISNSPGEGVQFKRTNGNYDSLWAADGVLKFSPNGTRGTTSNYPATYKIWHEGNDGSGSGLDADMLDGSHASAFLTLSTDQTITGKKTFTAPVLIRNNNYNKQLVLATVGADAKNKSAGIMFQTNDGDNAQDVILRHEWYDTFVPGYGIAISKHNSLEAGDSNMFFYNTGRYISKAPTGTAPYQCVSTTVNTNLNADMVDGVHSNQMFVEQRNAPSGKNIVKYVDLADATINHADFIPTLSSGTYVIPRTSGAGYSDTLVRFNSSNSTSGLEFLSSYTNEAALKFRKTIDNNRVSGPWTTIITNLNIGSQTVSKANNLTTARTLWGQSFNGGANVSGNMTGVGTISASGNVTAAGFVKSGISNANDYVLLAGGGTKAVSSFSAGGETNQNAFSNIKVGSTTITANAKTATFELAAGSNIQLAADTATRKVTITANVSSYSLPTAGQDVLGGIKLVTNTKNTAVTNNATTVAGRTYMVQLDSQNRAVVNVPWTDTNTTYGLASTATNGLLRQLSNNTTQYLRGDGQWSIPTQLKNGINNVTCTGSSVTISSGTGNSIEVNDIDWAVLVNAKTQFDIFIDGQANFYMYAQGIETNVPISTDSGFFDTSDARVKTNVKELDASKADKVRLVEFDRTDIEHHGYGVIAQELEEVYPEMVNTNNEGFKSVNYDELAMVKIKYLEDKVAKLEDIINKLLKQ